MAHRENDDTESVVSSMECIVCAYYSKTSNVPGLVQQTVRLPMSLVYEVYSTQHLDFSWSAKISVDESPVALKVLFKGETRAFCFNVVIVIMIMLLLFKAFFVIYPTRDVYILNWLDVWFDFLSLILYFDVTIFTSIIPCSLKWYRPSNFSVYRYTV